MKTVIEAVDRHLGRLVAAPAYTSVDALFEEFDNGCKSLALLPNLEARRRDARRLMAMLVEVDKAMRADARTRREDALRASLRCDEHFRLAMRNFRSAV